MIVEEDKLLRDALVLFFRTKGARVRSFNSGEEAVPEMQVLRPDIVISDRSLPGMDGLEFLRQIGARYPEAVRILIDAYPDAPFADEARGAGIDECLPKPLSIEEVERAMGRWFRTRSGGGNRPGGPDGRQDNEMAG